LAAMLKGRDLPPDLTWLAPMGTWSCVITPDEEGVQGYSVSGIGNQGFFLAGVAGGTVSVLQTMGLLPKPAGIPGTTSPAAAPPVSPPLTPPGNGAPAPGAVTEPSGAIIYITLEGKIFFDDTPVPMDQFADFLKSKKAANQALKLTVKVNQDASPDVLSRVMDAGASAGFGVLPYTYTSGANSFPPLTKSDSAVTPAVTNAVPTPAPENAPAPPSAPASSNAIATPPPPDTATNSVPITNSNPNGASPTPIPAQTPPTQ